VTAAARQGVSAGLRCVLFASGPFALPALERLATVSGKEGAPRLELVVSRPARPGGRGRRPNPTPVERRAAELGLPRATPASANDRAFLVELGARDADLFMVADYGEFLGRRLRELPRIGAYNLHASLLPRYRGAAPVAHAILNGEATTGVTLFRIVRDMDAGPVVATVETAILPGETTEDLEARLALLAADLLEATLPELAAGTFTERPQDEAYATRAPCLEKSQGAIDWRCSAVEVSRRVRAMHPWPGAFSFLERVSAPGTARERLRLLEVGDAGSTAPATAPPGTIVAVAVDHFSVACGQGVVDVTKLQRSGRAPLAVAAFLRGFPLAVGDAFVSGDRERSD
jgi:methionyl-tRNA formyltransferase